MLQVKSSLSFAKSVRKFLMFLRRGHLYFGLFLAPWAILYGVTAYLFNHPTHFPDQLLTAFGSSQVSAAGVLPIEDAADAVESVVAALQSRFPEERLELPSTTNVAWRGEFAFAEVEVDETLHQLLFYRNATGGTLRSGPLRASASTKNAKPAPFAIAAGGAAAGGRSTASGGTAIAENRHGDALHTAPLLIEPNWAVDAREALPVLFKSLGIELRDSQPILTSVPALQFELRSQSGNWQVEYNPLHGSVQATEATATAASDLSWRRFLLRLHTTHGYPSETSSRWIWAVFVDIMAFVMLFWALSGFIMWWHIKRTRKWGMAVFMTSVLLASYLAIGMHAELNIAQRQSAVAAK